MRILQVTVYGELKFGGVPQKVFALSEGIIGLGHQVQIVSFHSELREGGQGESPKGVKIDYLPWLGRNLLQFPKNVRKLRAMVRQADLVHCYGLYNFLCPLAALFSILADKPYLLEPEGMYVRRARSGKLKIVYHWLFTSWMASQSSQVVATSNTEADELTSLVSRDKIIIRRNGIDVNQFKNLPKNHQFRQKYGIENNEKVILFIGRISPIKNLENLIKAFGSLSIDRLRLLLVGPQLEPDYQLVLEELIQSLGLSEKVLLIGPLYQEDKLAALSGADLFVMPSQYESFGIAAAEAVASHVPVLLTETCGIATLIHRRAGLAVAQDVAGLAGGLKTLLNPESRKNLTARTGEVIEELSWDEPLLLTEQIYRYILASQLEDSK